MLQNEIRNWIGRKSHKRLNTDVAELVLYLSVGTL
jgi:hypothetical protein